MSNSSRIALVGLLALALWGCAMTETTTTVRVLPGPSAKRLRLLRPDAAPVSAVWRQEGSSFVGQLSFSNECSTETVQVNRHTQVTDTHPNRSYTTTAYVTGAVLSVIGIALVANAQGKSEQVTCGSGGGTPRSGDQCDSEAGAWREIGAITIGTGVGAFLGGVIVQTRKPVVELKELPSELQVRNQSQPNACGNLETLAGATIRATLSGGGSWTGTADRTGAVRIDLAGAAINQRDRAVFALESVKSDSTAVPLAGAPLGELDWEPPSPTSRHASTARASADCLRLLVAHSLTESALPCRHGGRVD